MGFLRQITKAAWYSYSLVAVLVAAFLFAPLVIFFLIYFTVAALVAFALIKIGGLLGRLSAAVGLRPGDAAKG